MRGRRLMGCSIIDFICLMVVHLHSYPTRRCWSAPGKLYPCRLSPCHRWIFVLRTPRRSRRSARELYPRPALCRCGWRMRCCWTRRRCYRWLVLRAPFLGNLPIVHELGRTGIVVRRSHREQMRVDGGQRLLGPGTEALLRARLVGGTAAGAGEAGLGCLGLEVGVERPRGVR